MATTIQITRPLVALRRLPDGPEGEKVYSAYHFAPGPQDRDALVERYGEKMYAEWVRRGDVSE